MTEAEHVVNLLYFSSQYVARCISTDKNAHVFADRVWSDSSRDADIPFPIRVADHTAGVTYVPPAGLPCEEIVPYDSQLGQLHGKAGPGS